MDSDKKENAILGLSSRYRGLWGAYTELGAWKWKNLIEQLVRIERENICVLNTGEPGRRKSYRTAPVSGNALLCTGLDLVFEQCRENGLIASYWLPGPEDELPAEFTAGSEETAEILESLVLQADREPMKLSMHSRGGKRLKHPAEGGYTEYLVKDRTLYVSAVQKRKDLKDSSGEQADLAENRKGRTAQAGRIRPEGERRPPESDSESESQREGRGNCFLHLNMRPTQ